MREIKLLQKIKEDPVREKRIEYEIIVDAYDESERAMGWYYYLEDAIHFPFRARCIAQRPTSPLKENEEVQVEGMAPEKECEKEMFVQIAWEKWKLAVPLSQLEPVGSDSETLEAIEDWHYWVCRGYQF